MASEIVYESPNHKFVWLGRDETGLEEGVHKHPLFPTGTAW
jgi:hypothetical protein